MRHHTPSVFPRTDDQSARYRVLYFQGHPTGAGRLIPRHCGLLDVRRLKNGTPSVHPLRGVEIRALRRVKRQAPASPYVFLTEGKAPMTPAGFRKMLCRAGEASGLPFPIHPHMLRHACGFKLAADGQDTRAVQHYLGHKNIQNTVRYTELSPERFRDFWKD